VGAAQVEEKQLQRESSEEHVKTITEPKTIEEYHQFLQEWSARAYNDKLKRSIQYFNFSYVLLRGYHSAIPDKIKEYYNVILDEFLNNRENRKYLG